MPKFSAELADRRENEIINACEKLYATMSFKEITIKEIGAVTSFGRTSIYNYFRTKEEIFLALLKREYDAWNDELSSALRIREEMTRAEFADFLAAALSRRETLLKILSMNLYDIEENSRAENLTDLKKSYGRSLALVGDCLARFFPEMSEEERQRFIYRFFPFVYGVYPYTHVTKKQEAAMKEAGIAFRQYSVYEMTLMGARKLLGIE